MTDDEMRSLVREAIARRTAAQTESVGNQTPLLQHASQARLSLGPGGDANGMCLIEPSVRCVHCGYCQALGH